MADHQGPRHQGRDASITPVVLADVNPAVLEDLVKLCIELARYQHGCCTEQPGPGQDETGPGSGQDEASGREDETGRRGTGPGPPAERGREALGKAIIGKAVDLLTSGPRHRTVFTERESILRSNDLTWK